jgi:ElaB/YqjD/DUF883 family membrane-anchored ribosome-binding protein
MALYQTPDSINNSGHAKADFKDLATDQLGKVAERVENAAHVAVEQAQEVGERVQAVTGQVKSAVEKSVKDQPMATLAMAAVVGFVLGALWKS